MIFWSCRKNGLIRKIRIFRNLWRHSLYRIITTTSLVQRKQLFTTNPVFFFLNNWRRVWNRVCLFITKWFHTQIIQIWNLQFFFGSENLHKVSKKLITEVHRAQQTSDKNSFTQIQRGGTYVPIHWWSVFHYKKALFKF